MAWPVYKHLVPSGTEQARSRVEEEIQRAAVASPEPRQRAALAHREVCDVYSTQPNTWSRPGRGGMFASAVVACAVTAAVLASWLPLQVSIVTVFLFAGPHNWFEFRYFLMRLPARFGRSRKFFVTAFAGLGILTVTYISYAVFCLKKKIVHVEPHLH